ncbi:hypothetical protein AB4Y63_12525 [Leifsonia sp. YAF41]|uniref:hypothetical protein n=1 Tax=Leifsonia sp. YAF41 TaxID=3233086 RepID=UPI003F95416D
MTVSDPGETVESRRSRQRRHQFSLVVILIMLVTVGAALVAVGPFGGRGFVISTIGAAAIVATLVLYQRRILGEMRTAILRQDPSATVVLGQLARTSPAPATIAGFRRSPSLNRSIWQAGVSIRDTSLETWAWDGRTPRRASRIPRSSITSVTIGPAHGMTRLHDCLRIEWVDHETTRWIELALIDLDCMIPRFLSDASIARAAGGLIGDTPQPQQSP